MAAPNIATASIYVGDLHPEVTEGNLFKAITPISPVTSIRVCRDSITRRSLGYAYVNFQTTEEAENVMNKLNGTLIKGKPCRMMWSQRDPSVRKSGKGNLFIKNLAKEVDTKIVLETFSKFGQILSCKVETNENGESKGYGYIQFSTQEEADTAMEAMHDSILYDKQIYVRPFIARRERQQEIVNSDFTNVFVKNLDPNIDSDKLNSIFSEFGPVKSAVVMRDEYGNSKEFGFVNFEDPESAKKAVEELNDKEVEGKPLYVAKALKKYEREAELRSKFEQMKIESGGKFQAVNLYVKNLDDDIDDEKLISFFKPFGNITSAKVMTDSRGNSRGFGFVCYSNSDEALRALQEMNGKMIGSKPLYVCLAQRKEDRRAMLEAHFTRAKLPGRMPPNSFMNGGPMFPQPNFMFPQMLQAQGRGRFPYQPIPGALQAIPGNYMMIPGRGMPMKPGRGGAPPRRGAMKQQMGIAPIPGVPFQYPPSYPLQPPVQPQPQQEQIPEKIEQERQSIGEQMYLQIVEVQPDLAEKITGMILESCALEESAKLVKDSDALKEKIDEAIKVLEEHGLLNKGKETTKEEENKE